MSKVLPGVQFTSFLGFGFLFTPLQDREYGKVAQSPKPVDDKECCQKRFPHTNPFKGLSVIQDLEVGGRLFLDEASKFPKTVMKEQKRI